MRHARLAVATVASGIATVGIQLVAMAVLPPEQFGVFSVVYLAGALAQSVLLSVICESWVRSDLQGASSASWKEYSSAALGVAIISGLAVGILAWIIPETRTNFVLPVIAVTATVYRSAARFHSLRCRRWAGVVPADLLGATGIVIFAGTISLLGGADLDAVLLGWAIVSTAGALASRPPSPGPDVSVAPWIRRHKTSIVPLLRDSLIMDAASIGTPYALVPILGLTNFGIYRAVSNVAAPVRLLLNPLRPTLSTLSPSSLRSGRLLIGTCSLAVTLGVAASVALLLLSDWAIDLGTLSALSPFAVPTGIFVAANCLGHAYYIIARQRAGGRAILLGRAVQTVAAIALPLSGGLLCGLAGAIWAYAGATATSAGVWLMIVRCSKLR